MCDDKLLLSWKPIISTLIKAVAKAADTVCHGVLVLSLSVSHVVHTCATAIWYFFPFRLSSLVRRQRAACVTRGQPASPCVVERLDWVRVYWRLWRQRVGKGQRRASWIKAAFQMFFAECNTAASYSYSCSMMHGVQSAETFSHSGLFDARWPPRVKEKYRRVRLTWVWNEWMNKYCNA